MPLGENHRFSFQGTLSWLGQVGVWSLVARVLALAIHRGWRENAQGLVLVEDWVWSDVVQGMTPTFVGFQVPSVWFLHCNASETPQCLFLGTFARVC